MATLNDLAATEADLKRAEAEIERLRAALEDARRDLLYLCPKRGSKSPKRLIIQEAVKRIEAALGNDHEQGASSDE